MGDGKTKDASTISLKKLRPRKKQKKKALRQSYTDSVTETENEFVSKILVHQQYPTHICHICAPQQTPPAAVAAAAASSAALTVRQIKQAAAYAQHAW